MLIRLTECFSSFMIQTQKAHSARSSHSAALSPIGLLIFHSHLISQFRSHLPTHSDPPRAPYKRILRPEIFVAPLRPPPRNNKGSVMGFHFNRKALCARLVVVTRCDSRQSCRGGLFIRKFFSSSPLSGSRPNLLETNKKTKSLATSSSTHWWHC